MRSSLWLSLLLPFLYSSSAVAQRGAGGPPPNVNTGPRPVESPTRPDSVQDSGLYGYWNNMTAQGRAGGALLGKVAIEGEVLPWDPILVTLSCNGTTSATTQTDPKGEFLIMPTRVAGELSQLGDRERQMEVHYEGCVAEAFLTGFRSTKTTISVRNLRDDPNIGTITLSRDSKARATAMSTTSQAAPDEASKLWSKAGGELRGDKPDRARKDLEKAVQIYPQFADAWYQLGRMQMLSSPHDAKMCFQKALGADPKFSLPLEQLAALSVQQEDWQGSTENTLRYLQLDPAGTPKIWYYSALSNFQLGRLNAAQYSAQKLMAADPLHNIRSGEQLFAAILARKADYAGALEHLRNCLTYTPDGPDAKMLKEQIAQLERRASAAKN